jgi:hypothetical protein
MRNYRAFLGFVMAGGLAAMGCSSDDEPMDGNDAVLELEFADLPALGDAAVYEGWLIVDGAPVSTGRFDVTEDGMTDPSSFSIARERADAAAMFVLTVEPAVGDDPAPSATHVLAGAIADGVASLTIGHEAALGADFLDATGSFILATPSSEAMDDDSQGIWWLMPPAMGGMPSAALSLPNLPEGWEYEGWVVGDEGPVSTGRFTALDQADSDAGGATAGPNGTPPFPGQDFIDPPVDLVGQTAVISVEPQPDDGAAPFILKPLVGMIGADTAPTSQTMSNNAAATTPSGMASIR